MRLESVLSVTGGTLLNSPSISAFETVALDPGKVKRGSLFVAKESAQIPAAVEQGAYGIVTDFDVVPTDEEIAWIRLPSLPSALVRLLRLWLVENPRKIFYLSPSIMEFLKRISYDRHIVVLQGNEEEMSETVLSSDPAHTLLCDDVKFLERIGHPLEKVDPAPVEATIVSSKLFETSMIVDGRYFHQLPLVPCLSSRLLHAIGILKTLAASHSFQHLEYTPSFDPLFVDAHGREVPFGTSEHVLILSNLPTLRECRETLEAAAWIERKIFFPRQIKFTCDIKLPIYRYDSLKHLLSIVHEDLGKPAYTIVVGADRESLRREMERSAKRSNPTDKGLF
ncbi:hypothetical protein [Hydrogenimonas sp.]